MHIKMHIKKAEHGLSFEGSPTEALEFVTSLQEAYRLAAKDMPQALSDLVFSIECALQDCGLLDDCFSPTN